MAANILRRLRAVQRGVFMIRAFVRMRTELAANTASFKRLAEIAFDDLASMIGPPPGNSLQKVYFGQVCSPVFSKPALV
jgi:hypothetical protein